MSPFGDYKLHHVGLVFQTFDIAADFMSLMELEEDFRGCVPKWECTCIFTKVTTGTAIELIVPEGGPLARFNKGFGGVHHYAYEVDDIIAATLQCENKGMKMLEPEPLKGAGNFLCNFITPISTRGMQIELVQMLS